MLRVASVLLIALAACSSSKDPDPEPSDNRLLGREVLNIAHGGAAIEAPKQTLLSYQRAVAAQADVLEVDLHSSSDGVLVVIHDDTVDATTDGSGRVNAMTFAELQTFDAGYRFKAADGSFPFRGQGLVIPAFEQLLDEFPDAYWVVEIKQDTPSIVAPVIELLRAKGAAERAIVASFIDPVIQEVRAHAPDVFTSMALGEGLEILSLTPEQEASYARPARFIQPPDTLSTQDNIDRLHRLGFKVQPWTINDPQRMQELIDWGADGIITDDPATLTGLLGRR
jgi:glycerophosphoryl diester phosphodiesterase